MTQPLRPASSNRPIPYDRRGFETMLRILIGILPLSVLCMILLLISCICFITIEAVSARPDNNPNTFLRWNRTSSNHTNTTSNSPILLCLGDSLTHGNCSASFTPEIPLQLSQKLGLPLTEHPRRTFADPLWVVNAGQNSITSHTILQERLAPTLQAIYPDYVLILIGTNDVQAMVRPKTWGKYISYINRLPNVPTLQTYQDNVQQIIQYIHTSVSSQIQIGICTLPPMGEDLRSEANQWIQRANTVLEQIVTQCHNDRVAIVPLYEALESIIEKKSGKVAPSSWFNLFDHWRIIAIVQNLLYHVTYGYCSWNCLSNAMCGYVVLSDGLHLNERGSAVLVDCIVQWLLQHNITKAIAVKRA
jgi:acyl-CoA thioesterase I